jgi:hypothetical protein
MQRICSEARNGQDKKRHTEVATRSEIRSEDRQAAPVDTLAADEDKDKVDEGGRCVE